MMEQPIMKIALNGLLIHVTKAYAANAQLKLRETYIFAKNA